MLKQCVTKASTSFPFCKNELKKLNELPYWLSYQAFEL